MTNGSRSSRCGSRRNGWHGGDGGNGSSASPSRLYREPQTGVLFGVCSGIAGYFGINPWIIRALAVMGLIMFTPPTAIAYILMAMLLPRAPERLYRSDEEARFWSRVRVDPAQSFSALRHRFRELEQRLRSLESYVTSEAYRVHREIEDLDRPQESRQAYPPRSGS